MKHKLRRVLEGDLTHNAIRELLQSALREQHQGEDTWVWIRDVADEWVAYEVETPESYDLFRVGYTISDDSEVTLNGTPEKVVINVSYEPVKESTERVTAGRVLEAKGSDADGGRVFAVEIVQVGTSRNGVKYSSQVLESAAPLYEGAKAFDHHRTVDELSTSTIAGLVGSYREPTFTGAAIQADLHLLPSATHTAEALDASLAAQTAGLAPIVGISHDIQLAHQPAEEGGRRIREAVQILGVLSADVVADPSAGGRVTRMVAGGLGATDTDPEEGVMTIEELIELLNGANEEQKASALAGLGITEDQLKSLAANPTGAPAAETTSDGDEPKVPAGVGAVTEATFARGSLHGEQLVRMAMERAKLDTRLTEAVVERLPERFTESDIAKGIKAWQDMLAGVEKVGLTPTIPHINVTKESLDKKRERLERTIEGGAAGGDGYLSIKQAYLDITSARVDPLSAELATAIIRESYLGHDRYEGRLTESVDTGTWGEVFADALHKRVIAEYRTPTLQLWRELVSSVVPRNDFRDAKLNRIGGYGTLPKVSEGAPYQNLVTPPDEDVRYKVEKRGGLEDYTMEAVANDDLSRLREIPRKLGRAASQTLFRAIFDLLATNPNIYDATALFAAGHANTDAASALSQSTLSTGRRKMRKQAAYGDAVEVLGITPKFLVVPSDLEETAFKLSTSAVAIVGAGGAEDATTPNIHQGLTPLVIDYWTDANDWFIVADPASIPTIEVGFFNNRQDPELFVQDDPRVGAVFTADKITWKIRHIWGLAVLDYRGFYRAQG